jgi:hypothetical protein
VSTGDQHDPAQGGIVPPHILKAIAYRDELAEWLEKTLAADHGVEPHQFDATALATALIGAGWSGPCVKGASRDTERT